ncbi:MAG: OmpA family protein [Pseudomonadota bacterium]
MRSTIFGALTIVGAIAPASLAAQDLTADLATTDRDELRGALQVRYDAALAATNDSAVVAANDTRYMWASEAKVQCAIALGYLKSNTRDETSIEKCDYAYGMMNIIAQPPAPPPPPPPPPPPAQVCEAPQPGLVFFEFDSDVPAEDAAEIIQFTARNADGCEWDSFNVVGHTDRAGSNAYNDELSMRRAQAVADLMESLGISRDQLTITAEGELNPRVPTADGIRSPENRRVEITVKQ